MKKYLPAAAAILLLSSTPHLSAYEPTENPEYPVPAGDYTLSNQWTKAKERLTACQSSHDPASQDRIKKYLTPGATCLEIGPGLGSMSKFIAEQIGSSGSVTAIDNDPAFLETVSTQSPVIQTLQEDITTYELTQGSYDFIYIRLVLIHLTTADIPALINKLASALKPGGYLFIDELSDMPNKLRFDDFGKLNAQLPEFLDQLYKMMSNRIDFTLVYKLPDILTHAGLENVSSEIVSHRVSGNTGYGDNMLLSIEQLEDYIKGHPQYDELYPVLRTAWKDPNLHWFSHGRAFIVGRKGTPVPLEANKDEL